MDKQDAINPDHYKSTTSLECIEAMEIIFGPEQVMDFCICNAWKYIWRWKNKNGDEDLSKATWYLDRVIFLRDNRNVPCRYNSQITGMYNYILNSRGEIRSYSE